MVFQETRSFIASQLICQATSEATCAVSHFSMSSCIKAVVHKITPGTTTHSSLAVSLNTVFHFGFLAVKNVTIKLYSDADHREQVIALWKTCFGYDAPHNHPALSINKKLEVNDGLFFVALEGDVVVGTAMGGYDGHRGWIYSMAVAPSHRRKGVGAQLMSHAEQALAKTGCVKINIQILEGNESVVAFYEKLGYTVEKRISMAKRMPQNLPPKPN